MALPPLLSLTTTAEGLSVYRFPADWLCIAKRPGQRPEGLPWTVVAEALRSLPPGSAALDGPMSGYPGSLADDEMLGMAWDARAGLYNPSWPGYERRGITLGVDVEGRPFAREGSYTRADLERLRALAAIQCYPMLVRRGASPGGFRQDSGTTGRAALCAWQDRTMGFAVGAMPMLAFSRALVACGVWDGGYTDGGGSTNLLLQSGERAAPGHDGRRIRSWIFAVPSPGAGSSSGPGPWLAVGALGLAAWFVLRKGVR